MSESDDEFHDCETDDGELIDTPTEKVEREKINKTLQIIILRRVNSGQEFIFEKALWACFLLRHTYRL